MLIDIDKIKVNDRIRKDLGDLSELAEDIEKNGLINPPVVTPDYELIAGERRLEAMRQLGYKQVEVRTFVPDDAEHKLMIEISENEERKEFTKTERIDYARQLERIERVKASQREKAGVAIDPSQNSDGGRTDDIVAEKLGIGSRDTYRKEKYIADNADPETLEQWNKEEISTHKAYKRVKELERELEEKEKANRKLTEQISQMENQVEVIEKEVIPEDYKDLKNEVDGLLKDNEELKNKLYMERDRKKEAISQLKAEDAKREIIDQVQGFHYRIAGFIKEVGGLLYLTEYIDEVPPSTKKMFLSSIKYLREFSEQLYKNVESNLKEN
ncbi:ParB N-terminal domain-containing protein [Anaerococcus sp. AGMB09787]|uniref:ParB N-terminal domain-containing protein n=1 Tax=Anaerococcus sp. AGMB09787 TaxID=2922869 RepID=UPI001FAEC82E|nr:ParB N-terminal domain-containing protein [Anaerococcus sp. AGMB09787]